jgi:hypothetical protein
MRGNGLGEHAAGACPVARLPGQAGVGSPNAAAGCPGSAAPALDRSCRFSQTLR